MKPKNLTHRIMVRLSSVQFDQLERATRRRNQEREMHVAPSTLAREFILKGCASTLKDGAS